MLWTQVMKLTVFSLAGVSHPRDKAQALSRGNTRLIEDAPRFIPGSGTERGATPVRDVGDVKMIGIKIPLGLVEIGSSKNVLDVFVLEAHVNLVVVALDARSALPAESGAASITSVRK